MEIEVVFPRLNEIPEALSTHFRDMLACLEYTNSNAVLTTYGRYDHVYEIFDSEGLLKCLFKSCKGDEIESKIETSVYLLDHPIDGPRSSSPAIYGFAGVLPTISVRFRDFRGKSMSGVLVEFKEFDRHIDDYFGDEFNLGPNNEDMHRIALLDVRLGNMDRNASNILVTIEEHLPHFVPRFVPIDHGMCFTSGRGVKYNLCSPYWLTDDLETGMHEALSEECIFYVERLDVDADIAFLRKCGWNLPQKYAKRFKIFTAFLKRTISRGLTLFHIGRMASYKCNDQKYNLEEIVRTVEEEFVGRVDNRIEERLLEYDELTLLKNKPKRRKKR